MTLQNQILTEVKNNLTDNVFITPDIYEYKSNLAYLEENNNKDLINIISRTISENNIDILTDYFTSMFEENENEQYNTEFEKLKQSVIENSPFKEDEINSWFEDENNMEVVQELLYDNDWQKGENLIGDLIKSIGHLNVYIPTGININDYWEVDMDSEEWRNDLKQFLNIFPIKDFEDASDDIYTLYSQGDTGELCIWFTFNMSDFVSEDGMELRIPKQIIFSDKLITLGIVNFEVGGGDSVDLYLSENLVINVNNESFIFDYITGYNYVHDVAGMIRDWCVSTVSFNYNNHTETAKTFNSKILDDVSIQKKYELNWSQGNCTKGDINMNRHKTRNYFNEPPYCRWECSSCGQVWLD